MSGVMVTGNNREESVVLVDDANHVITSMPKAQVHHGATPLHRGFSIFLFDDGGRVLLQRRADTKATWPGFWSNSCCGHELPDENVTDAAVRRAGFELGVSVRDVEVILPNYRYRAEYEGVVENEFCPVMIGRVSANPVPEESEVSGTEWVTWDQLVERCKRHDPTLSPWCIEEVLLLNENPRFLTVVAPGRGGDS